MPFAPTLERVTEHLSGLISAAESYREEVAELKEQAASHKHTPRTLKVWEWQVDAASSLCSSLEEVHDQLMRIVEQDYVLRRPDADDILV